MAEYIPKRNLRVDLLVDNGDEVDVMISEDTQLTLPSDVFHEMFDEAALHEILKWDCNCSKLGFVHVPARFLVEMSQDPRPFMPLSIAIQMFQREYATDKAAYKDYAHPKLGPAMFNLTEDLLAQGRVDRNIFKR